MGDHAADIEAEQQLLVGQKRYHDKVSAKVKLRTKYPQQMGGDLSLAAALDQQEEEPEQQQEPSIAEPKTLSRFQKAKSKRLKAELRMVTLAKRVGKSAMNSVVKSNREIRSIPSWSASARALGGDIGGEGNVRGLAHVAKPVAAINYERSRGIHHLSPHIEVVLEPLPAPTRDTPWMGQALGESMRKTTKGRTRRSRKIGSCPGKAWNR